MGVAARVADDDEVVVVVAGRVNRRGYADVDGAAGDDDRVVASARSSSPRSSSLKVESSSGCPDTEGCFEIRASSPAMSAGESTRSTQQAAMALRGIESCLAVLSSAKMIPSSALIASRLSVPSLAVPESTTPMARSWRSCASDSKKESI